MPVPDANSALGSALASCDKPSEGFEALALPGARGEVKFDRCYRGRDHLVCSFGALLAEARSLLENYQRIIDTKYPDLSNLEGVCGIKSDTLATDLESATDFNARFKALKAQYDARVSCASRVQQSFRDLTLSDMAQAPDLLKSMIETIEGDITRYRIRSGSLQAAQPHRAVRQSPQAIPAHRHPIRENRQSLPFNAMRRSSETLNQNRQHGLVALGHENWMKY